MILRIGEKTVAGAVHQCVNGAFDSLQEFLNDDAPAGFAENAELHGAVNGLGRGRGGFGNDHALAQGQAIRLDHEGVFGRAAPGLRFPAVGKLPRFGRGDAVPPHEVLGENLRRFQPRGGGGGTEDALSRPLEGIDDSGCQGIVRSDHR